MNSKEENEFTDENMLNVNDSKKVSNQGANYEENGTENSLREAISSDKNVNQRKTEIEKKENDEIQEFQMDTLEEDEDTICGIGRFKPKWLQKYATARNYLILYSILGVIHGTYYAYLIGIVSTLEKRFAYKSKVSGVIMVVDEISPLILGISVGYFGGRAHRPRIVALGMFLMSFCCLLSAFPFFIYGPAQHLVYSNSTGPEVCNFQQKREECDEDDRPPTLTAVVFLTFGSLLKGFGNLAFYTVGLAYMDDNTKKSHSPVYFGTTLVMRELGPTLGFLMSSAFLKIYENPFVDPGFNREDPRWIGAWWMGFVLQAILLLIFTFPLLLFPRRLPNQKKVHLPESTAADNENIVRKIKGLYVGVKRLSSNKIYVCMIVIAIFSVSRGTGLYMNLAKYIEKQFRMSASDASLFAGPPGLISFQVSTIVGSIIMWKFHPTARTLIIGMTIFEFLGVIVCLLLMIPSCPNINLSGITSQEIGLELQNECNKDCFCTTNVFTPLCGPDGVSTYFSSCHAGCSYSLPKDEKGTEAFGNCSCVLSSNGSFITVEKMERGYCVDEGCWTQSIIFVILFPMLEVVSGAFITAFVMLVMRSVDPPDKSFALGTVQTIVCPFASIPAPIIFGALADTACLIWEFSCGSTGNCWVYDMKKFSYLVHGVAALYYLAAVPCYVKLFTLSHKFPDLYAEPGDEEIPEEEKQSKHDEKGDYASVKCIPENNMEATSL